MPKARALVLAALLLAAPLLALGAAGGAAARDVAGTKDHPLLSRYPGATIKWQDVQNHLPYRIAIGKVAGYRKVDDWIDTRGRVTRTFYELTGQRTHVEVYANYRKALVDAGFTLVADGLHPQSSQAPAVGSRQWLPIHYAANALPPSAGIDLLAGSATAGGTGFLAGKKDRAAGLVYAAIGITQQRADRVTLLLDIVEVDEAETGLVTADAEAMGADIDEHGRVALHGLHFDHDKATLKPESKPALDEIAKLLKARPKLDAYVVGHTDGTGKLAYNLKLSQERAAAVIDALARDYGIARQRLEPHGVGPLSPVFANRGDGGRARNRRVELVER